MVELRRLSARALYAELRGLPASQFQPKIQLPRALYEPDGTAVDSNKAGVVAAALKTFEELDAIVSLSDLW